MDDAWFDCAVNVVKNNSGLLKTMLTGKGAGISDASVSSFIDTASSLDPATLKMLMKAVKYLSELQKPMYEAYLKLDKWTFGMAQYIVGILVIFIGYYVLKALWYFFYFVFAGVMNLYRLATNTPLPSPVSPPTELSNAAVNKVADVAASVGAAVGAGAATAGAATAAAKEAAKVLNKKVAEESADAEFEF